ncbi:MAG: FAD/NAD(P)-binding protein [Sandaracinaceae bacterium]|nr:FAD/NAD(P)-binding protein [Sandaracinaceae bacterium]
MLPTEDSPSPSLSPRLAQIVRRFSALGDHVTRRDAISILASCELELSDIERFVEESSHGYARRRVARTDAFEMLVMTWKPGQGSVPHDHARSLCALRIVSGRVRETRYAPARDGLVDASSAGDATETEVLVDTSEHIHALRNLEDAPSTLVTLHVYAPPLPELRRYTARPEGSSLESVFARPRAPAAPTVAIVGGGFSGTMVAAHLIERATAEGLPLCVVLVDRQASLAEGPAYRTPDPRHLLNVPASNMSAWPDRPSDFYDWARERDPRVEPTSFLPRKLYGEYVRSRFLEAAARAGERVSAEVRRDEVAAIKRTRSERQRLELSGGTLDADVVVLATGHRQPDDPLARVWRGSRARYVEDPWSSLALTAIRPDETVLVLGTGLTAVDALLSIARQPRSAPVLAVSRRGLAPERHAETPRAPIDPTPWLEPLLAAPGGATTRALVRAVRHAAARTEDWRPVVDGLRPYTTRIWRSLSPAEASRFVRHARPFWEVRRHRMAPEIGRFVDEAVASGVFRAVAGRVRRAEADDDGVTVELGVRGETGSRIVRAHWVVNCTGPGSGPCLVPVVRSLVDGGLLEPDALGLGVRTSDEGRALAGGREADDLFIVGTLRKPDLWESTAVPELRRQAARTAQLVLERAGGRGPS